ncbi:glycosyltransferase [Miltoncostaea marina]|uniref:glycosyltransferase n=1 Tax=Miltoncostaea marina TaxID=2843215 RepID=UPI001C3C9695|nr:glycosyltransferase [Miltoncostaea marina]
MTRTPAPDPRRVGYIMSAFPTVTETFILFEIIELERTGARVEIFPLRPRGDETSHPEAAPLARRTRYAHVGAPATIAAQLHWLRRAPRAYLGAWWAALRGNLRSRPFLLRALVVVPLAARFAREMQALGVSHVHAHWATHPALAANVVHRLTGLPYSFTAHAHDIYIDRSMLEEKIRDAAFVVTISDFNRSLLGRLYGDWAAAKTSVIRCGVDLTAFTPRPPRPAEGGPFTVSCIAGLREKKGQAHLVEAVARLRDEGLEVRCLLVGDGELRGRLEARIAELGVGDRVELLGHRSRDEVSAVLKGSDAMVLPSVTTDDGDMEGIPVALMEALATEVPVVASSLSGIPELVRDGETGLLVPEGDPAAIAAAIRRIHDDPAGAARMAAAGRERVLAAYDLERNTAELRRLLLWEYDGPALPAAPAA